MKNINITKYFIPEKPGTSGVEAQGKCAARFGFTLAEALLTLLIISIVVAMSTLVVAKKNKKMQANNMTHYWYCTRSSVDGEHISGTNFSPSPGSSDSSGCRFSPPAGVNKFNVTVIGGGGGGASGFPILDDEQVFTPGTYSFQPHSDGQYYMILVGGGGGGGGHNWKCGRGDLGGRSAALIADYFQLSKSTVYSLTVGKLGKGAEGSHQGSAGESTTFSDGGGFSLVAGGGGGGARRTPSFPVGCKNRGGGEPGTFSPDTVNGVNGYKNDGRIGAYILYDFYMEKYRAETLDIANKLPTGYKNAGCGGVGNQNHGQNGCDGIAMIQLVRVYGGGGGQAGKLAFHQFKNAPEQASIYIGKGGKGATEIDSNGEPGGASRFGDKMIAAGGNGGITRAVSKNEFTIEGENGYKSLMPTGLVSEYSTSVEAAGGTFETAGSNAVTPGSGGGGGGANVKTGAWSGGGDGAPGIVIVVW